MAFAARRSSGRRVRRRTGLGPRRFFARSALTLVFVSAAGCGEPRSVGDYLRPELRARVEGLKAEVARAPTSPATAEQRARVLWEWLNAYSLTGGDTNVNMPSTVAVILGKGARTPDVLRRVDMFVRELQIRDEQPGAIGSLTSGDRKSVV